MDAEHLASEPREYASSTTAWLTELVTRCLHGDERAFALIVDQYGELLLRTAYMLIQDEETARDIVQDSLLLAWKQMHQLREPAFLRSWLLHIVVNQSTSLKRQWARKAHWLRQQSQQQQIEAATHSAELQRSLVEETIDMWQAIGKLPFNQRAVLVLFYYHRMTIPEIASMLNTSENTLRKRLKLALAKVRKILGVAPVSAQKQEIRPGTLPTHAGYAGSKRDE